MRPNVKAHYWGARGSEYIGRVLGEEGPLFEALRNIDLSKGRVFSYVADHFPLDEVDDFDAEAPWSRDESEASFEAISEEVDHVCRHLASSKSSVVLLHSPIDERVSCFTPSALRRLRVKEQPSEDVNWSCQVLSHADASGDTVRNAVSNAWAFPFVAVMTEADIDESGLGSTDLNRTEIVEVCQRLSCLVVNALDDEIWLFWEACKEDNGQ